MARPTDEEMLKFKTFFEESVVDHAPGGKMFKYHQYMADTKYAHEQHEIAKKRLENHLKRCSCINLNP